MRQRIRSDRGLTSVEAALVTPAVFLLMLLMIQGLLAALQNRTAQFAAEQAANAAARYEATDGDGQTAAEDILDQLGTQDSTVQINRSADQVEATVEVEVPRIIIDMTVTAEAAAPIEEFLELGERS